MDTGQREQAVALRREGLSKRQIRQRLGLAGDWELTEWLRGEPPPAWTARPNAKDEQRRRARELRRQGWSGPRIAAELGVSKSSVSLWVRDLPPSGRGPAAGDFWRLRMEEAYWGPLRERNARERARTRERAAAEVGELADRELFLLGVGLYWAEGTKSKPWRRSERVAFVNSDPDVITVYLAWLDLLGIERTRLSFRLQIHESADADAAERFWAQIAGIPVAEMRPTTFKRHNPATVRRNTGEGYRGCLRVDVRSGSDLYRRIEGWWCGIVGGAARRVGSDGRAG